MVEAGLCSIWGFSMHGYTRSSHKHGEKADVWLYMGVLCTFGSNKVLYIGLYILQCQRTWAPPPVCHLYAAFFSMQ